MLFRRSRRSRRNPYVNVTKKALEAALAGKKPSRSTASAAARKAPARKPASRSTASKARRKQPKSYRFLSKRYSAAGASMWQRIAAAEKAKRDAANAKAQAEAAKAKAAAATAAAASAKARAEAEADPRIKMGENPYRRRRRNGRRRNPAYTTIASIRRARRAVRAGNVTRGAASTRKRYKMRSNPRPYTAKTMMRARRSIRNVYATRTAKAFRTRFRMRSNPGMAGIVAVLKQTLPVAGALYGARALSGKLTGRIPGFDQIPADYRGPAMAALLLVGGHFATDKVAPMRKYRDGIMVGLGLNMMDALVRAFAPAEVKAYIGMGDSYSAGLSDYVQMGDYLSIGATPIDDDITLGEYVGVGGVQEELGVEEELGVVEELGGALDRSYLGGVSRDSLLRDVPSVPLLAAAPERSFTRDVRHAGSGYDRSDSLYTGIFAD